MSKSESSLPPGTFIFYDESGDTGTKFGRGSTNYFISTVLIVPRYKVKEVDELITNTRCRYNYFSEIKYTKIKGKLLTTFIHQITKLKDVFAFSPDFLKLVSLP